MLVDYEAVLHDLEAYMQGKSGNSFGQRELTDLLAELRVRHRQPEGLVERALRLFDPELQEILAVQRGQSAAGSVEVEPEMAKSAPFRNGSD